MSSPITLLADEYVRKRAKLDARVRRLEKKLSKIEGKSTFQETKTQCALPGCYHEGILLCVECESARYCSRDCQERHKQGNHKHDCRYWAELLHMSPMQAGQIFLSGCNKQRYPYALKILDFYAFENRSARMSICKVINAHSFPQFNAPLFMACSDNQLLLIKKLISLSVNLDCQGSHPFEWTALMLCIDKRYTEAAMILIKAGANVHIRNLFGDTALMHAVEEDNLIVVEALLQQGARTDVRGKSTESPYYLCTIQQSTKKGTRYSAKMNHLLSSPRAEANNRKPSPYPLPDIRMSVTVRYEGNRRSSNTDIAHASNNRSGVNHPSKKAKKAKSTHKPMKGGPSSGHPVMMLSEADMITLATNAVIASDGSMVIPGEECSIS